MSTISNVVATTLSERGQSAYFSYAEPVVAALEAREDAIVTALRQVATSKGLSEADTGVILEQVGLVEPTPEPTPEPVSADNGSDTLAEVLATVRSLQSDIEGLKTAARRHGVTV